MGAALSSLLRMVQSRAATILVIALALLGAAGAQTAAAGARPARTRGHLTPSVQVRVVEQINAIRREFHLPPGRLTVRYATDVQLAADQDRDPLLSPVQPGMMSEYGVWGVSTPFRPVSTAHLTSHLVDAWVYSDGWRGAGTWNLDCTGPDATGCNAHRRAVLSPAPVPGARLWIDVADHPTLIGRTRALSLAVLLVWTRP